MKKTIWPSDKGRSISQPRQDSWMFGLGVFKKTINQENKKNR
jgi:hypothetical protein